MGDKMFETLPSNLGNLGEQNNSKPSHLPYIQSWGVCCFLRTGRTQVLRTGRSEAQQCLEGVGEGKLFFFLSRQNVRKVLWGKKKALHLSVNVFSTKVLIGDTIFLLEKGPPFYVVIRATRRSSRLQCKGSTFISQLF